MNPPVSCCSSRVRTRWRAQWTGGSTEPNMIVMLMRSPTRVRGAVGFEPLVRRDLVGAEDRADLVVEDLRRGPGQELRPGLLSRRR